MTPPLSRSFLALAIIACPAGVIFAGAPAWGVNKLDDHSTVEVRTYVALADRNGKPVSLLLGCKENHFSPELRFPTRIGFHQIQMSYRFDSGDFTLRAAPLSDDGDRMFPWQAESSNVTAAFQHSRRLQVQVGIVLFEFDLGSAKSAMQKIPCA